jgi:Tat protein translocase TatB subunit
MLNLGFSEILFVVALAVVVVGPDRLPEMVRFLGRQYGKLRRASDELRRAFMFEADKAETERRASLLRKRREEVRVQADAARARAQATLAEGKAPDAVPRTEPEHVEGPPLEDRPEEETSTEAPET